MTERYISFKGEGIRAILYERKRQTRRVIRLPPWSTCNWEDFKLDEYGIPLIICRETGCWAEVECPYGKPGDILWVRETWRTEADYDLVSPRNIPQTVAIQRKADLNIKKNHNDISFGKWRPSIFMPRWVSRIDLVIENIRIERVQDISLQDCIAEGMTFQEERKARASFTGKAYQQEWWKSLWNSINAKRGFSYEDNSWVWVIDFWVKETK